MSKLIPVPTSKNNVKDMHYHGHLQKLITSRNGTVYIPEQSGWKNNVS